MSISCAKCARSTVSIPAGTVDRRSVRTIHEAGQRPGPIAATAVSCSRRRGRGTRFSVRRGDEFLGDFRYRCCSFFWSVRVPDGQLPQAQAHQGCSLLTVGIFQGWNAIRRSTLHRRVSAPAFASRTTALLILTSTNRLLDLVCAPLHYAMCICAAIIVECQSSTGAQPRPRRTPRGRDLCEDESF
jgi:hypothetical protein